MKFIPGNTFLNNTTKGGRYLQRGVLYTLKNIKKADDQYFKYSFTTLDGDKEIKFKSIEEADNFLTNFIY